MLEATGQPLAGVEDAVEDTRFGTVVGTLAMEAAGIATGRADPFTVIDGACWGYLRGSRCLLLLCR